MTHEKIDRLVLVMNTNKIKYNKQFDSILEHGFSDESKEAYFEDLIEDLESLLKTGVNTEFNKSMKEAVFVLTDLAVRSGEDGWHGRSLDRLRQDKKNCLAAIKTPKEAAMDFDLRYNIRQYIESTKTAMDLLKKSDLAQTDVEYKNMKTCRSLLDEIDKTVDQVLDMSSSAAGERYNEIVEKLHTWRSKLARSGGLYDASSVGLLRETLNAAKAWYKLCLSGVKDAKVKNIYDIPEDDLTRILESETIKQSLEMFLSRCAAYADETATMRNDGTMERIAEARAEIRRIEAREQDIVAQFRNKEISRDDAEIELQNLKDEKDNQNYRIERLNAGRISRQEIEMRRELIAKVERPIQECYKHVRHNRLHVHALFSGMDFARLVGMINNNVSSAEFAIGIEEMQTTLVTRGVIDQQGRFSVENINEKLALTEAVSNEHLGVDTPVKAESEGSLLDQFLAKDEKQESGSLLDALEKQTESPAKRSVRLDDIL